MGGSITGTSTQQISNFYRSFAGTDALVFIMLPKTEPIVLGSLSTISYSLYRDKKPVPLLGRINIGGFTRGTRLYAGTLIFTLLNQHWVDDIREKVPWLRNLKPVKADELPLFDLMIMCANEYGATMQMFIYGVDLTEEGQVLSVEDLFIENTFNFVARDVSTFSQEFKTNTRTTIVQPYITAGNFTLSASRQTPSVVSAKQTANYLGIVAPSDVKAIQHLLNDTLDQNLSLNGEYDDDTMRAVQYFQLNQGITPTGLMDARTFDRLSEQAKKKEADKIQLTSPLLQDRIKSTSEESLALAPFKESGDYQFDYHSAEWVNGIGVVSTSANPISVKVQVQVAFQTGRCVTSLYEEIIAPFRTLTMASYLMTLSDDEGLSDPKRLSFLIYAIDGDVYKWNIHF